MTLLASYIFSKYATQTYMEWWRNEEYPLAKEPAILALMAPWGIQNRRMHMLARGVMGPEDRLWNSCGARCMTEKLVFNRCTDNQRRTLRREPPLQLPGKP